ncbi:BUD22 family protein [Schizosaccharomyces japonicus yFS275]|uniref:BUD22 family protein n=1 Tax=Schizosaccharomyces japonicus (strain yFS275 / FY16936) TaxID=402676 RepID=B6K080_SCHJY|nr:BUD22 family protein [Schizosaccharomyces japonicus yFS275]EEB06230.1 BUD22 family protein [Schizosaccharomyces japonicus yFS275]
MRQNRSIKRKRAQKSQKFPKEQKFTAENAKKRVESIKKIITQSLKKALGFEEQKLIRRIKNAKENEKEEDKIPRLEEELKAAKALKPSDLCDYCYFSKVLKNPRIREFLYETLYAESPLKSASEPARNVISRVYKTKAVVDAVQSIIIQTERLMATVGGLRAHDPADNANDLLKKTHNESQAVKAEDKVKGVTENPTSDDNSKLNESQPVEGKGDLNEQISVETNADQAMVDDTEATSSMQSQNDSEEEIEEDPMFDIPRRQKKENASTLPELMTGFIDPGEESVESDIEAEAGELLKPQRKNRRGQRARRAIWEKKYGKKANHVIKKNEEFQKKREERQRKFEERKARYEARMARRGPEEKAKPAADDKPLHPSWEAKKKLRQIPSVPFQGKKIVFD